MSSEPNFSGYRNHPDYTAPFLLHAWQAAAASSPSVVTAALAILILTFANGFFNSMAVALGASFPYSTFLFDPNDIFADLIKVAASYPGPAPTDLDQRLLWEARYFSQNPYGGVASLEQGKLTHFHLLPLTTITNLAVRSLLVHWHAPAVLTLFTLLWLAPLAALPWFLNTARRVSMLLTLTVLISYPVLMAVTRGNVFAGYTGTCLVLAMFLTFRHRAILSIVALLAVAINFRPNAALFLLLPLLGFPVARATAIAGASAVGAGLLFSLSFALAHWAYPDYTLENVMQGLAIYYRGYVLGNDGLNYGSSGFGLAKVIVAMLPSVPIRLGLINTLVSFFRLSC